MFKIVVATNLIGGIGLNGKIPWKCPADMKYFRETTTGHVVVMGRKTYESIGKPLNNRVNVVISTVMPETPGVVVVREPLDAVRYCQKNQKGKEWFVIGGQDIYSWFIDNGFVSHICNTIIGDSTPCDKHFSTIYQRVERLEQRELGDGAYLRVDRVVNPEEEKFLEIMADIYKNGNHKSDRTGTGTVSLFGKQLRFDLTNNKFPLITTRRMFLRGIFAELMLYVRGQTSSKILEAQGINVWTGNTSREFLDKRGLTHMPVGDMGSSYGFLFRHFGAKYTTCEADYTGQGFDQLKYVIDTIKTDPNNRRIMISLWDPNSLANCPLPPCLYNYQFYVNGKQLSCMMTQRSSDYMVAGGWNVATGALLTYMIASVCDLEPYELIWNIGDAHIYSNLFKQVEEQLSRKPGVFPKLYLKKKENIEDFEFSDLELLCYNPQASIEVVMNV